MWLNLDYIYIYKAVIIGLLLDDAGGPAVWEDKSDSDRSYLIGIASESWITMLGQKGKIRKILASHNTFLERP